MLEESWFPWVVVFLRRFMLNVLKSYDIMITPLRSVGYRCFINLPLLYPGNFKFISVLISFFKDTAVLLTRVLLSSCKAENGCSALSQGGCRSFLCCDLFVLVGVWSVLSKSVNDIVISNSNSLVPIISAWSSRGLLSISILCSLEWSELYPCQGQPISSVRMFSLLSSKLEYDPSICLILKLTPFVPNCHISPTNKKLEVVIFTQDQTGCKLCVKLLNLHGHELHVREDSPTLLRFGIHFLRSPVEAPTRDMGFGLKMLKDFAPTTLPFMLARYPSSVSTMEHSFPSSIASTARAIYDHLLVKKDFVKHAFMVESTLVPIDSSNIVKLPRFEYPFEELMEPLSFFPFTHCTVCCKNSPLYEGLI